jgi:hypothetical protein
MTSIGGRIVVNNESTIYIMFNEYCISNATVSAPAGFKRWELIWKAAGGAQINIKVATSDLS